MYAMKPYTSYLASTGIPFRKPCGSFSIGNSSVSWFLRLAKEREVHWFTTLVFLRKETMYLATRKHSSVINVLYRQ